MAVVGVLMAACWPVPAIAQQAPSAPDPLVQSGAELYARDCQSCHGVAGRGAAGTGQAAGARGVLGAGPSLIGVGAASAHLYLTTGYMPLEEADDRPARSEVRYDDAELRGLIAYVASLGEGPPIPAVRPERGDLVEGKKLFTERCAGCHQMASEGGVALDAVAPELERSTPTQIAEAIRVGPYLMPPFGEADLSDADVDSIVRYVLSTDAPRDEGGWGIGHIGPIPEGLVAWVVAAFVLAGVARIIGEWRKA